MSGAYPCDADDVAALAADGVTCVMNLCEDDEYEDGDRDAVVAAYASRSIAEERVGVVDYGNLMPGAIEVAAEQVAAWLNEGEHVYVHCRAGWQRSAVVAAAALAVRDGVDPEEALGSLKRPKPGAETAPQRTQELLL